MTWAFLVKSGAIFLLALPLGLLITLLFGSLNRGPGRIILAAAIGAFLAGLAVGISLLVYGIVSDRLVTTSTLGIPFMVAFGCGFIGAVFGALILDRRRNQPTEGNG